MKSQKEIKNYLSFELSEMLYELNDGNIDEEMLYIFFSKILINANVDSKIVVDVLERTEFGDIGKTVARYIKVDEGW